MQDQSPIEVFHMCLYPIILYTVYTYSTKVRAHLSLSCWPIVCLSMLYTAESSCVVILFPGSMHTSLFYVIDFSPCIYKRHWCIRAFIRFSLPLLSHGFVFQPNYSCLVPSLFSPLLILFFHVNLCTCLLFISSNSAFTCMYVYMILKCICSYLYNLYLGHVCRTHTATYFVEKPIHAYVLISVRYMSSLPWFQAIIHAVMCSLFKRISPIYESYILIVRCRLNAHDCSDITPL